MTSNTTLLTCLLGTGLLLAGCGPIDEPHDTGSARIDVRSTNQALISDIDTVEITISGTGISPPIVELLAGDPVAGWQGTITDIPIGTDRTFDGAAYDGTDVIYAGSASPVNILPDQMALVTLFMSDTTPPPPFYNAAPRITGLVVSDYELMPSGTATLTVTATDPDGDPLVYAWSSPSGSFSAPGAATTNWTAPASSGSVLLHVGVSDPSGATATLDVSMTVGTGMGSAYVIADINTAPEVQNMVPDPTRIDAGDTTYLDLTATDSDGDALTYDWNEVFPCEGFFDDPTIEDPAFELAALPNGDADCEIEVTVSDGRGGVNFGTLSVATGPGPCPSGPCGPTPPAPGELLWSTPRYLEGDTDTIGVVELPYAPYLPSGLLAAVASSYPVDDPQFAVVLYTYEGSTVDWIVDETTTEDTALAAAANSLGDIVVAGRQDDSSLTSPNILMRAYDASLSSLWEITAPGLGIYGALVDDADDLWALQYVGTGPSYYVALQRYDSHTGGAEFGTSVSSSVQPLDGGDLAADLSGNLIACVTRDMATSTGPDIWLAKFDTSTLEFVWQTTWDSGAPDSCEDVAVSGTGDIFVTGARIAGDSDMWIGRFDSAGAFINSVDFDSGGDESGRGIAVAPTGHVYAVGTDEWGAPTLRAYFPTLSPRWSVTPLGTAADVVVDRNGDILVAGATASFGSTGAADVLLSKFAP